MPSFTLALALLLPAAPLAPGEAGVADFVLRDAAGGARRLSDWKGSPVVVVAFLGADCPLAKLYGPRLAELARVYAPRGVAFLGIGSNDHDSLADLARYARAHNLPFPVLKDFGNVAADLLGARRTPEVFVLNAARVVRYRGRIDDQYGVGVHRPKADHQELVDALEDLLAGLPVRTPATEAPGCLIDRRAKAAVAGPITFCRDVAPLLQRRCQVCHRPGQVGPFELRTYQDAAGWAGMIREVVTAGRMPPWGANPAHGRFANDPSLTDREKRMLLDWIDADCPEGDPADLPSPVVFPEGWSIGQPDLVVSMPTAFAVPAQSVVEYQSFEVDPGFREDRWVRAAEIRPGNRKVVHHCNVFLQPPGAADVTEQGALGSYCLAAMAQGTPPLTLSDGLAKRVPAGWKLVFVMHYTPIGTPQTDRTSIGLQFADPATVTQEVATKLMFDRDLRIPPGEGNYRVEQTWRINDDVLLLAFFPHMHLRGRSFRYEALYPDGSTEILLDVPRFDFAWQPRYALAEPKLLPTGASIRCTAVYDNSKENPANPDPSNWVYTGTQTWEEMFNGYFDVVLADQDLTRPAPWHARIARPAFATFVVLLAGGWLAGRRWIAIGRREPPCGLPDSVACKSPVLDHAGKLLSWRVEGRGQPR